MPKNIYPPEVKKALRECSSGNGYSCEDCPFKNIEKCTDHLAEVSLSLINQYENKIEILEKAQVDYAKAILDEYAERLKSDFALAMSDGNIPFCEIVDELTNTMKSEYRSYPDFTDLIVEKAIKEFAERFKSFLNLDQSGEEETVSFEDIDNLVTEFLNESKVSE